MKYFKLISFVVLLLFYTCHLQAKKSDAEQVFSYYYDHGIWGFNENGQGTSGWGSTIEATKAYVAFLTNFIKENQIEKIVDIGCGDWEFSKTINWEGIEYLGCDVVKDVIERNKSLYASSNIAFLQLDLITDSIPDADLLICKDVLQHLTNEDIRIFLSKIGHVKHCLITNDIATSPKNSMRFFSENIDIPHRGPNRPLDLTMPPFNVVGTKLLTYPLRDHVKQVIYIYNP